MEAKKLRLGFLEDFKVKAVICGDCNIINLCAFSSVDNGSIVEFCEYYFGDFLLQNSEKEIILSFAPLMRDFNLITNSGFSWGQISFDGMKKSIMDFYSRTSMLNNIIEWLPTGSKEISRKKPGLYLRYGCVELNVIESYIYDRDNLRKTVMEFIGSGAHKSQDRMYYKNIQSGWLKTDDIEQDFRKLMTNAGFYCSDDPFEAWCMLSGWAQSYLEGLKDAYLFDCVGAFPFYMGAQKYLKKEYGVNAEYYSFPGGLKFYEHLSGRDVLFVTPLHDVINIQYESGNIFKLYTDFIVPEFSLKTLPAYVSTWPNKPHRGYDETFLTMCESIDEAVRVGRYSLFLASCGLYGVPLCRYVWKKHKINSIYFGNHIHGFFGIRQKANDGFCGLTRNEKFWVDSDLGKYKNIDLIDDGRYMA